MRPLENYCASQKISVVPTALCLRDKDAARLLGVPSHDTKKSSLAATAMAASAKPLLPQQKRSAATPSAIFAFLTVSRRVRWYRLSSVGPFIPRCRLGFIKLFASAFSTKDAQGHSQITFLFFSGPTKPQSFSFMNSTLQKVGAHLDLQLRPYRTKLTQSISEFSLWKSQV